MTVYQHTDVSASFSLLNRCSFEERSLRGPASSPRKHRNKDTRANVTVSALPGTDAAVDIPLDGTVRVLGTGGSSF